jgi:hypothetical protein
VKTTARIISALGLAAASTFAVWIMVMEFANARLGIPLAVRLVVMAAVMGLVGIGLGARTARVQGRLSPALIGVAAVFPLAAWRTYQFVTYHASDPSLSRLLLRELGIIFFTMGVPCIAGVYWLWSTARKAGLSHN